VIGLTGPIGAGKTLVGSMLRELGCAVINADDLAKEILSEPRGVEFVRNQLGATCVRTDGTLDRKAIAEMIFSRPEKKKQIEDHIYPVLHERQNRLMAAYQADPAVKAIVIESPLLIETGLKSLCDRVILVVAEVRLRRKRVAAYRRWSPDELVRREKFFLPIHLKQSIADDILVNNSTIDACRQQVKKAFSQMISSDTC